MSRDFPREAGELLRLVSYLKRSFGDRNGAQKSGGPGDIPQLYFSAGFQQHPVPGAVMRLKGLAGCNWLWLDGGCCQATAVADAGVF